MPRWGKVGKQKIEDAGTLYPEADGDRGRRDPRPRRSSSSTRPRPTTSRSSCGSTRRACTSSRISRRSTKRCATRRTAGPSRKPAWPSSTTSSASVMKKLKDMGVDDNTIVVFTTDNGTETFTWPDGGNTPFTGQRARSMEGGFRAPCDDPLAGQSPGRQGRERHHLRPRLVPDASSPPPATRTSPTS